jgi:hypothetical protein
MARTYYKFTADDNEHPVFCIGCTDHIPKVVADNNRGLCPNCIDAIQASKRADQAAPQGSTSPIGPAPSASSSTLPQGPAPSPKYSWAPAGKTCPQCGSERHEFAERCICGHNFRDTSNEAMDPRRTQLGGFGVNRLSYEEAIRYLDEKTLIGMNPEAVKVISSQPGQRTTTAPQVTKSAPGSAAVQNQNPGANVMGCLGLLFVVYVGFHAACRGSDASPSSATSTTGSEVSNPVPNSSPGSNSDYQARSPSIPAVGDVRSVRSSGALGAVTDESFRDMISAEVANDKEGLEKMAINSELVALSAGTQVRCIGYGPGLGGGLHVRVLSGDLYGDDYWITENSLN